jgi:uncharacterized protein YdeI (YjbR/CyaY-like superfamily)
MPANRQLDRKRYAVSEDLSGIIGVFLPEASSGKGPGTMKVPYAKKWQKETDKLRQIALDCDLTEELKWGKPCFTFLKKTWRS